METDEGEHGWRPSATRQEKCEQRNDDSEKQHVQVVVVLGKPKHRVSRLPCEKFRDYSQPVQIRCDRGQRDHGAFAPPFHSQSYVVPEHFRGHRRVGGIETLLRIDTSDSQQYATSAPDVEVASQRGEDNLADWSTAPRMRYL